MEIKNKNKLNPILVIIILVVINVMEITHYNANATTILTGPFSLCHDNQELFDDINIPSLNEQEMTMVTDDSQSEWLEKKDKEEEEEEYSDYPLPNMPTDKRLNIQPLRQPSVPTLKQLKKFSESIDWGENGYEEEQEEEDKYEKIIEEEEDNYETETENPEEEYIGYYN